MTCNGCNSTRLCYVCYVPTDLDIGGGDYVDFGFCLDCGMMRGKFPKEQTELESREEEPR